MVETVVQRGWRGLGIDNEEYAGAAGWDPRLPAAFAAFLRNATAAFARAQKVLVVDICSTWNGTGWFRLVTPHF